MVEGRVKITQWHGQRALIAIGEKINAPVQMPMEFTG